MSKKTRRKLYSNLYETDILDFDVLEELDEITPVKENKAIKRAANKNRRDSINSSKPSTKQLQQDVTIKTNPVEATCNKCQSPVTGELISDIYLPHLDKLVPVITYKCPNCGHSGRRSVIALALPINQYEKKYFG